MFKIEETIQKIYESINPVKSDIEKLLRVTSPKGMRILFDFADGVRRRFMSDAVVFRGIIEFSNICVNKCAYCGLNRNNEKITRYSMTEESIMKAVSKIHCAGIETVVFQSGENPSLDARWLAALIKKIKENFNITVTLCLGEKTYEEYKMFKDSGAGRYLLKIETSNKALYEKLHPGMSFENRLRCLDYLKELNFQVGSGNIIGLKGQTIEDIARDLLFLKKQDFYMIAVGPFIAHPQTELAQEYPGSIDLSLKVTALTRILTKDKYIPATAALGKDRVKGLKAGANVIMLNFTPAEYGKFYEIYPMRKASEYQRVKVENYDTIEIAGAIRGAYRI